MLTNRQYAFARDLDGVRVIVTVNNDDNASSMSLPAGNAAEYVGTLTGEKVPVENGRINISVAGNSGNIWVPAGDMPEYKPVEMNGKMPEKAEAEKSELTDAEKAKAEAAATVAEQEAGQKTEQNDVNANAPVSEENSQIQTNSNETAQAQTTVSSSIQPTDSEKSEITVDWSKRPEDMTVEELQAGILAKMANNGPVTDQMKKTVYDNIWHDSLVNWLKSFR